jgi:hypothetical protein
MYFVGRMHNDVLEIIFGFKRDEMTGGSRKLLCEELHNL